MIESVFVPVGLPKSTPPCGLRDCPLNTLRAPMFEEKVVDHLLGLGKFEVVDDVD